MSLENALDMLKASTRRRAEVQNARFMFRKGRHALAMTAVQATGYRVLSELGHQDAADAAIEEVIAEARAPGRFLRPFERREIDSFLRGFR